MKMLRAFSAGLTLTALLALPSTTAAQSAPYRQLGWVSSMTASCMDPSCQKVTFTLDLNGLQPTDNTGAAVPAGLGSSGGYLNWLALGSVGGPWFTGATISSGGTWFSIPVMSALLNFSIPTYPVDPVIIVATFNTGAYNKEFGYAGMAYLNGNGTPVTGPCNAGTCTYVAGDFSGSATAAPEPITMTLLATGLVGLMLVARRKRKQQPAK